MKKKIAVITGSRAEYGILKPLIRELVGQEDMELFLIVTGMHLSPEFGLTYREIEADGYKICEKIEILLSSDTFVGINKSIGLGMMSFGEVYERVKPDLVLVLGDRYEIFAAASAAMVARIPIAHLHGGELTEGAIDESIRHAITKMSHLHFTSTEAYKKRVIQLGEQPDRVFNVGALGVENTKRLKLLTKAELQNELGFNLDKKYAMVTYHPVTLDGCMSGNQFRELLAALEEFDELNIIFTKANADTDGRIINQMIDEYVKVNSNRCIAFTSMGQLRYLSALQYAEAVVGNSSSGIIEAPSFGIATINIGDRQKGRILAQSVIQVECQKEAIKEAIEKALDEETKRKNRYVKNPYEGKDTSRQIVRCIKSYLCGPYKEVKKTFYDL